MESNQLFDGLINGDFGRTPTNVPALILGLLMAFAGGHVLTWTYIATHSGLSYSRSYVRALLIMPVIVALVMNVLANNIITAFGMMAVFAVVRFRNMIRDTFDTMYLLLAIALGMTTGSQKFTTALIGGIVTTFVLYYLWFTSFGLRHRYDVILNLHWARSPAELAELNRVLERHTRTRQVASQRTGVGGIGLDLSYWLLLRDPARADELMIDLGEIKGVSHLSSINAEDETEV